MAGKLKEFLKEQYNKIYDEYYESRLYDLLNRYNELKDENPLFFSSKYDYMNSFIGRLVEINLVYQALTKEDCEVFVYDVEMPLLTESEINSERNKKAIVFQTKLFWIKSFNIVVCFEPFAFPEGVEYCLREEIIKVSEPKDCDKIKDAKVLSFSHALKDKYYMDYVSFLKLIYNDNKKGNTIINLIGNYINKIDKLYEMTLSDFYKDNKEKFYFYAMNIIYSKNTLNLEHEQKNQIFDYILTNEYVDEIIKMLFTFNFTASSIKKYSNLDFLDFTFIPVELFKVTELVFNLLLNTYWKDKEIKDSHNNQICFSNKKLELGKMQQFFYSTDTEIEEYLFKKENLVRQLKEIMGRWISKTRNGFLHKDVLNYETLAKSIEDSFNILCLLILILRR